MSSPSQDVPEFAARFEAVDPRGGRRAGVVVGALAAVVVSAGLAWWLSGDDRGRMVSQAEATTPGVAAPQPRVSLASTAPDPGQVKRAYDEVRTVYADGGAQALADVLRGCAETLMSDPRILDYCLAFDMYAQAIAPPQGEAAQWFQVGEARRLRLARQALPPAADPEGRLAEIAQLMRSASGSEVRTAAPQPPVRATTVKQARQASAAKTARSTSRCRFAPTPAERLLCANPQLQTVDRRMKQAYRKALAAGADREILEGEQAAWRTARNGASDRREMADLYARRLRELEQHIAQAN
jgi:uncharacterized protein YecT (DUF1311 family)